MGCHSNWVCLCVSLESCKARYKPLEDSSRGGGLFSLVRSHLPRLASPAGSFFVQTCLLRLWVCKEGGYRVLGLWVKACICYIKRPCHGFSKWQTHNAHVRVRVFVCICRVWLCSLPCVRGDSVPVTGRASKNILSRVRAREGHPTPLPFAMQT